MTMPAESGRPDAVTSDAIAQPWLRRLDGETDVHFFARYARQKIDRFLQASDAADSGRENRSNPEVMRKLNTAERYAAFNMKGAVEVLHESLNPKQES
jgi:hypothetical protein